MCEIQTVSVSPCGGHKGLTVSQSCLQSGTFLLQERWEISQRAEPLRPELKAAFSVTAKVVGREARHIFRRLSLAQCCMEERTLKYKELKEKSWEESVAGFNVAVKHVNLDCVFDFSLLPVGYCMRESTFGELRFCWNLVRCRTGASSAVGLKLDPSALLHRYFLALQWAQSFQFYAIENLSTMVEVFLHH